MLKNLKTNRKSFQELVQENKMILMQDKQALERIERRIEQRYEAAALKKTARLS